MSFISPWALIFLMLVPALVVAYRWHELRRRGDAVRLGAFGLSTDATGRPSAARRYTPPLLFLAAASLLVFAMARPQMTIPVPSLEGTVMLTFDVSASMAADDVEPTRMEAAKAAARAFVERRPDTVKVGVVSFGEGGLVLQEPTDNADDITAAIDRLVPQSGTSLGRGVLAALDAVSDNPALDELGDEEFGTLPPPTRTSTDGFEAAIILLFTDGENLSEPDPLEIAQVAIEHGVRIYAVGVGTGDGATVEIEGFNVHTQIDEALLEEIVSIAEGTYFRLDDAEDIQTIYEDVGLQFITRSQKMEITAVLAGLSMIVLLVGGALSLLWFGRVP